MEEISERSELRRMQREQERERRRMRDRQRRQSMTLEQREKHLSRRRRNYQLRRLRAEGARSGSQTGQTSMLSRGDSINSDEHQAVTSFSGLSVKCNSVTHVGTNQGEEKLNVDCAESERLEALAHKSPNVPRRLRLSHIRHLARSLNNSMGELAGNHQMVAAVITKGDVASNCLQVGCSDSGISPQSLRLNRVKHLARTFNNSANSATKEAIGQNHKSGTEVEQKLPCGEIQLMSHDDPKIDERLSLAIEEREPFTWSHATNGVCLPFLNRTEKTKRNYSMGIH